jgi:isopenicillin N synthase-like dioxygenase
MNAAVSKSSSGLYCNTLPVIDFQPFLQGKPAARSSVVQAIDHASRELGFFYLTNHGIPQSLIDRAFDCAQQFFALPLARKREIAIERSTCHRGYFSVGGENLDPVAQGEQGDYKEGIKIGRDLSQAHPLVQAGLALHGPNQWPANLPGWQENLQAYFDACQTLGHSLMQAFALALDLPEQYFDHCLAEPMATLGPLHYPPHPAPSARLGAGAHTDYGCLTLLAQDNKGGLQVCNRAGQWIEARPVPGTLLVNIGDMLARWSNDRFASTRHRVINRSGQDRYSIPFFYDPDFNADISCLPSCCSADNPARYAPTCGGQYLLDRIAEAFAYQRD